MIYPLIAGLALIGSPSTQEATMPPLHVVGRNLVDDGGKTVTLKGCNVGNWLINEFWMLGIEGKPGVPRDQYSLEKVLAQRFGRREKDRLMDLYRSSWMTDRDWANIHNFGFNLVRVPFNYRLLEDDDQPMKLKEDAFRWLQTAVDQAAKHQIYVILDMHGVQGGQTENDHTGRVGQNKLWSVPENQERMAWLWRQIALKYRSNPTVIAYDPMNEPYGGTKPQIFSVFSKAYASIRSVDPDKLIFAPGYTDNFDFYGDPKERGWHNVGFQMHYYPGLFGDPPTIKSTIRHLNRLAGVEEKLKKLDVPFIVGEMNVVLKTDGGGAMMRRFFDADAAYGWLTTMWSYKVITDTGDTSGGCWGMYTNAGPAKTVNFDADSKDQIEAYFRSFATQPLVAYDDLRTYMLDPHPPLPPLPAAAQPRTTAPGDQVLTGWTSTDVNGSLKGGLVGDGPASFDLYGGGDDIWSSSDQFRFLHREVTGDFDLEVTVANVEPTEGYTKAGLMVRASLAADAATALLSVFPTGESQVAIRNAAGANMEGSDGPSNVLPKARFKIQRRGSTLIFSVNDHEVKRSMLPALAGTVSVGPIALSHSNGELTKIAYQNLRLTRQ